MQCYWMSFSMWMQRNNFCFWLDTQLSVCVIKKRHRHKNVKIFNFQSPALSHLLAHLFPLFSIFWPPLMSDSAQHLQPYLFIQAGFFFLHIYNNLSCVKVKSWTFAMRLNLSAQDSFSLTAVKLSRLPAQPSTLLLVDNLLVRYNNTAKTTYY